MTISAGMIINAAGASGKDRSGNGCKRFAVSSTRDGVNLSHHFWRLPPGTYNAFFPEKCVIGSGREGCITRKNGENALLLCQKITNTTIKEDLV